MIGVIGVLLLGLAGMGFLYRQAQAEMVVLEKNNTTLKNNFAKAKQNAAQWQEDLERLLEVTKQQEKLIISRNQEAEKLREESSGWKRRFEDAKQQNQELAQWADQQLPDYVTHRLHELSGSSGTGETGGVPGGPPTGVTRINESTGVSGLD